MKEFLDQKYAHFKDKVKIIPHFFDINEMPEELNKSPNKKMSFIYGGTIYQGTIKWYEEFSNAISAIYGNVSISLYSYDLKLDCKSENGLIKLKKGIKETDLLIKICNADYYITVIQKLIKTLFRQNFIKLYI